MTTEAEFLQAMEEGSLSNWGRWGADDDAANVGRNDRPPPPGDPGTYNDFWWERGTALERTSLIIDPPDGRLPPRTEAGEIRAGWTRGADSWTDRAMAERCVTRGAPKRPGGYNNHFLVLQVPGYVVMLQEMVHEPRTEGRSVRRWPTTSFRRRRSRANGISTDRDSGPGPYEYCHEGNYGMENLLRGARVQEGDVPAR